MERDERLIFLLGHARHRVYLRLDQALGQRADRGTGGEEVERPPTDRVVASREEMGDVGVEALDSRPCSPNAPGRAMPLVRVGNPSFTFVLIPAHRLVVSRRQARIIGEHLFGRAHTAGRLDASDPFRSERAREPVERRKRRSVIEKWRDGDDYRKAKVATASDVDHRSWRSLDLSFDDSAVIHPDRRRSR